MEKKRNDENDRTGNHAAGEDVYADRKRLKTTTITSWLIEKGFMSKQADADGKSKRLPTAMGERIGLTVKLREGQYGTYQAVYYSEEAQRFLLDHLQEILQTEK